MKKIIKREIARFGSRYALAKKLGITVSTIQRWENGSAPPISFLKFLLYISKDEKELKKNIENFIEKG